MIDAEIEDIMNHFAHTRSDTEVVEHYFKTLYEKKPQPGHVFFQVSW